MKNWYDLSISFEAEDDEADAIAQSALLAVCTGPKWKHWGCWRILPLRLRPRSCPREFAAAWEPSPWDDEGEPKERDPKALRTRCFPPRFPYPAQFPSFWGESLTLTNASSTTWTLSGEPS